jgi:type IV pilus assembly protein PilC
LLVFQYYARSITGKPIKGLLEASTKDEALQKLRAQKLFVISIEQRSKKININLIKKSKVPIKDLAVFCRQLSTMLNAGLPLLNCLDILKQQTENKNLKKVIEQVTAAVQEGESLGNSFRQHKEIPQLMLYMIDAGELGGVLDEVLARLATHLEKEYAVTEKVKSAMAYPIVVLFIAVLAVITLLTFVVPTFKEILNDLGVELPLFTRILLSFGDWMKNYWHLLVFCCVLIFYGLIIFLQTKDGRKLKDHIMLKAPVFGKLNQKVAVSRFTRTLGTLLKGGVPILTALDVVKKIVNNQIIEEELELVQVKIENGDEMASQLAKSKVFTPMIAHMVAVGEETGKLDTMLEKISDFYDSEVNNMVSKISSLLEPLIVIVLGSIVGTIILAIILPMFSVISSI